MGRSPSRFCRFTRRLLSEAGQLLAAASGAKDAAVAADEKGFAVRGETKSRRVALGANGGAGGSAVIGAQGSLLERIASGFLSIGEIPQHHVARFLAAGGDRFGVGREERM